MSKRHSHRRRGREIKRRAAFVVRHYECGHRVRARRPRPAPILKPILDKLGRLPRPNYASMWFGIHASIAGGCGRCEMPRSLGWRDAAETATFESLLAPETKRDSPSHPVGDDDGHKVTVRSWPTNFPLSARFVVDDPVVVADGDTPDDDEPAT